VAARLAERRGLRAALLAAGCAALTLVFFALRFPYDRFRGALVAAAARATGAEVEVGALSGALGRGGVSLVAAPVSLRWPEGARVGLERAAFWPALSVSWLAGRPALGLGLRAPEGTLDGTLWIAEPLAFEGELRDLALERLPPEFLEAAEGFALTGLLDARGSLERGDDGVSGEVALEVRDGAVSAPGAPVSIPFETLRAELAFGGGGVVQLVSASLEGPMLEGSAKGQIGTEASSSPLDLEMDLRSADPGVRAWLTPLGVRLDREGRARFHLGGTLVAPEVR
jgi:type II secretion system protein N